MAARPATNVLSLHKDNAEWILAKLKELGTGRENQIFEVFFRRPNIAPRPAGPELFQSQIAGACRFGRPDLQPAL